MSNPLARRRPRDVARARRRLWSPPAHWRLLAFCLAVVGVLIVFQGIATHTIGASAEPHQSAGAAAPLRGSRALLVTRGGRLVSAQPPAGRRVALTFDDGPDPRWTPRIAAVLRRNHVPGAFFVVGSEAARHPDVVRMLADEGHEIGNHTFTHTALSNGPEWQERLQLDLTQAVLVGITGRYARLVRPPYSATPDAVSPYQERRLATAAGTRYVIALADLDSRDWQRKGVASIVRDATPRGQQGGVVMFHDGGGDRGQTVRALEQLIPRLRSRGFEFVSLSKLTGVPEAALAPAASAGERRRGWLFASSVRLAFALVALLVGAVLLVGVLVAARVAVLLALATHHVRTTRRGADEEYLPSVVVVVPAYNEEVGIARAVRSLVSSDYPALEVVVVDDGSTDATASVVERLGLERVRLVRQNNGGKAVALNTGVSLSASEVVVMVDGDTVFEPDTVRRLVQPMADERVGAVSGNTKVGNRGGLLGRWQHIEYVTGFNVDRRMYEVLQCTTTVPGAIGAFRRDALDEVGGVSGDTLAEDTDLTLAIGRTGRRVVYAEDARAWTEAPSTLGGLWRQRYRWSYGTMQAVWKHRGAVVSRDPRHARIGRRALPYVTLFQILLPILAPLIDLLAVYGLVFTDPVPVIGAWAAFNALQVLLAIFAFRLDGESLRPLWALPVQQFVYRQLMYLVVIEATISALVGIRGQWKTIPRTGDVQVQPG
ncbi:MAG: bifunctional polysaccharide deacetylase/glycosyltransferase family 2 protein [Actinomycetota bacterium]|nr:bifunctional polysaccharide deacetylase/glycosyltransferase family 2 protein [Actinomycetota bacterium]